MRLLIALVASSALLAGCGNSDEPESKTETPGASETVVEVTMKDACPQLEAAWVDEGYLLSQEFIDLVLEFKRDADAETVNAMTEVRETIGDQLDLGSDPVAGGGFEMSPMGHESIRETIRSRCQAAGSSAFS